MKHKCFMFSHSHGLIWVPPPNQKWVSWVQTGKSKIINKLNSQVKGWLALGKTPVKLRWLEGHIFLLSVWSMLSNSSSFLEVRLDGFQFRQAYNSGYTLFLFYNTSCIQTIPLSIASGKGSCAFIIISSFLLVIAFSDYLVICGSEVQ